MKKRTEKIKKIENLIKKNKVSRRGFMHSLGKTVALSAIATTGIASFLSCEKENLEEEKNKNNSNSSSLKTVCTSHECIVEFTCPIQPAFSCLESFTCINSSCEEGSLFTCNVGVITCISLYSHQGGAGS